MKAIKFLFLLSFCILLVSCNDDNKDDDFKFDTESLIQTKWTGTMTESHPSGSIEISDVGIVFYTEDSGEYSYKYKNSVFDPTQGSFNYTLDGKCLNIQHALQLSGKWLLIYADKKEMEFERGTGGVDAYNSTLKLKRNR